MNFDDLKIIWDEEKSRPSCVVDEEALHRLVGERVSTFRNTIFWRDFMEVAVSVVLTFLFLGRAFSGASEWGGLLSLHCVAHYLVVLGLAFLSTYLLVTRHRQARREREFDESVQGNLRKLISNVTFQIGLLKSVAWWYLGPLVPGLVLFFLTVLPEPEPDDTVLLGFLRPLEAGLIVFVFVLYTFIWWVNQQAVKKNLLPQRQELESLLAKLEQVEEE